MYKVNLKLKDNELPAKINAETGEVSKVTINANKNNGMETFDLMDKFQRTNSNAWRLLETQTNDGEFSLANKLALRARAYTNSIVPLNDETTLKALGEELSVSRNTVKKKIDKLFKLGVLGKFEVYEAHEVHKKYWIFNPYLSFNGKVVKSDIKYLFQNTTYALMSGR